MSTGNPFRIDPTKPVFTKTFAQKSKAKEANKYKKVHSPIIDHENVIVSQNKQFHKNVLKPQRHLIVSDDAIPSNTNNSHGYNLRNQRTK